MMNFKKNQKKSYKVYWYFVNLLIIQALLIFEIIVFKDLNYPLRNNLKQHSYNNNHSNKNEEIIHNTLYL